MRPISRVCRSLRKLSRRVVARAQGLRPPSARSIASRAPRTTLRTRRSLAPEARLAALDRYERALDGDRSGLPPASRPFPELAAAISAPSPVPGAACATSCRRSGRTSLTTRYATFDRARLLPPLRQSRRPADAPALFGRSRRRTAMRATRSAPRSNSSTSGRTWPPIGRRIAYICRKTNSRDSALPRRTLPRRVAMTPGGR
jgi:hypothetical protein